MIVSPSSHDDEFAPARRPVATSVSFWAWTIIGVVIGGMGISVSVFGALAPYMVKESGERALTIVLLMAIGMTIVRLAAALVAVAGVMRSGRRWARTTLTILGVVAFFLPLILWRTDPLTALLLGIHSPALPFMLLSVAAVATMYAPSSNGYFRRAGRVH